MNEQEIGYISKYFGKINVGAIEITSGKLTTGDTIHIQGHTTNLEEKITSMQIEHLSVSEAKAGDSIGMKVSEKVRRSSLLHALLWKRCSGRRGTQLQFTSRVSTNGL